MTNREAGYTYKRCPKIRKAIETIDMFYETPCPEWKKSPDSKGHLFNKNNWQACTKGEIELCWLDQEIEYIDPKQGAALHFDKDHKLNAISAKCPKCHNYVIMDLLPDDIIDMLVDMQKINKRRKNA